MYLVYPCTRPYSEAQHTKHNVASNNKEISNTKIQFPSEQISTFMGHNNNNNNNSNNNRNQGLI